MVGGETSNEADLALCYIGEQPPLPGPSEQMVDKGLKSRCVTGVFTRNFLQEPEKGCVNGTINRKETSFRWGMLVQGKAL